MPSSVKIMLLIINGLYVAYTVYLFITFIGFYTSDQKVVTPDVNRVNDDDNGQLPPKFASHVHSGAIGVSVVLTLVASLKFMAIYKDSLCGTGFFLILQILAAIILSVSGHWLIVHIMNVSVVLNFFLHVFSVASMVFTVILGVWLLAIIVVVEMVLMVIFVIQLRFRKNTDDTVVIV